MKILNKKDFTLAELLEFINEAKDDVKVYESCFNLRYTRDLIKEDNKNGQLDPITDFYNEKYIITSVSDIEGQQEPQTTGYIRDFSEHEADVLNLKIERDIEDGYVYSTFETAILTDKYLVLL